MIRTTYFVFTTLSTVGYGDMSAVSNFEKINGMIYMFMGTGIFAVILSTFSDLIGDSTDASEAQVLDLH
jgi:hypothetical protein